MKMLLSTTAVTLALALPTLVLAQTATSPATDPAVQTEAADMPGFLGMRGQSDLYASELMGHDVYARREAVETMAANGQSTDAAGGMHDLAMMNSAELDTMDNIGQINEIVLSNDNKVRALVIGVGGFLGMGERNVAVTMDQVTFATDATDNSTMYIVVNTGGDMLKASPAYKTSAMVGGLSDQKEVMPATDRMALTRPNLNRDGYDQVKASDMSTEMLVGKTVYGVDDGTVGTVNDLIVDGSGKITEVVIDFGGFLGMGKSEVSLGFDELTILSKPDQSDVRVYVDATKEQIQALPKYEAVN